MPSPYFPNYCHSHYTKDLSNCFIYSNTPFFETLPIKTRQKKKNRLPNHTVVQLDSSLFIFYLCHSKNNCVILITEDLQELMLYLLHFLHILQSSSQNVVPNLVLLFPIQQQFRKYHEDQGY